MGCNFLYQFVPGPTHAAGKKLDLVLCNWSVIIENVLTFHPREGIFPSDHYVVEFEIRLKFQRAKKYENKLMTLRTGILMTYGNLLLEYLRYSFF